MKEDKKVVFNKKKYTTTIILSFLVFLAKVLISIAKNGGNEIFVYVAKGIFIATIFFTLLSLYNVYTYKE